MAESASQGAAQAGKRGLVVEALGSHGEFVSAQDLHAALRASGDRVGLATVYRVLQQLAADGEVDVLRNDAGEATYRSCSPSHHHHLVCRECGRTVEVGAPAIERWATTTGRQHGFSEVSHSVELSGICDRH